MRWRFHWSVVYVEPDLGRKIKAGILIGESSVLRK